MRTSIVAHQDQLKRGLTLIELMVVVGVISLLMTLTIQAVLASLEASRKARCANSMRQLGIALNSYHAEFSAFPSASGVPNYQKFGRDVTISQLKQYSLLSQILPNLGEIALFNALNFQNAIEDFYRYPSATNDLGVSQNSTALASVIQSLICPSDPRAGLPGWTGATSYRINLGVGEEMKAPGNRRGPIFAYQNSTIATTTDGASNTVALSERFIGETGSTRYSIQSAYLKGSFFAPSDTPDESVYRCSSLQSSQNKNHFETATGLTWAVGTLGQTCYSHTLQPNSPIADCEIMPSSPILGVISARSAHRNSVTVLVLDGAARSVTDSINRSVWRSIGTCAGGEVITEF